MAVCLVVMMVGFVVAWQGAWLASGARARTTADLVALAAAEAQSEGDPACEIAETAARGNGAALASCQVTTGWGEFVVEVQVEVPMVPRIAGAPERVAADSRAGIIHDP